MNVINVKEKDTFAKIIKHRKIGGERTFNRQGPSFHFLLFSLSFSFSFSLSHYMWFNSRFGDRPNS